MKHDKPATLLKLAELREGFNRLERGELVAMCSILLDLYVQKSAQLEELCAEVMKLPADFTGKN